jgi:hypothetical protein
MPILGGSEFAVGTHQAGGRTVSGRWGLIGKLVDIFQPNECANYFKSCGYEPE